MQKFEILYNYAFTANTVSNEVSEVVVNEVLYKNQQNLILDKDYYSYKSQVGGSIVNDLNVKEFLDKSENETIATSYIDHLNSKLTKEEFRDIFYDNKKLAEYFNEFYKSYKNQEIEQSNFRTANDELNDKLKNSFIGDRKAVQENPNTNYYLSDSNVNSQLRTTNVSNVSGYSENYYISIFVNKKNGILNNDDFSDYFKDTYDGTIKYAKSKYINKVNSFNSYGNLEFLMDQKNKYNTQNSFGPIKEEIQKIKNYLPSYYLFNEESGIPEPITADPLDISQLGAYNNINSVFEFINIPYSNPQNQFNNFRTYTEFKNAFNFKFNAWNPDFINYAFNDKYIYQQKISFVKVTNDLFLNTIVDDTVNLIPSEFEFILSTDSNDLTQMGQIYDDLSTNKLKVKVKYNGLSSSLNKSNKAILKYEYFSPSSLGIDNQFNSFNFENNSSLNTTLELIFDTISDTQEITLDVYKNWNVRIPIILSLRPYNNPNQICEYIVIYLEEFFKITEYQSNSTFDFNAIQKGKLMYNGYVDQKYNDNFLEFYRPETI